MKSLVLMGSNLTRDFSYPIGFAGFCGLEIGGSGGSMISTPIVGRASTPLGDSPLAPSSRAARIR